MPETTPYDAPPPLTPTAATRPGNDAASDRWSPPDPSQFALVRKPGGGSEFVQRSSLPSEQPNSAGGTPNQAASGSTTPPAAVADGRLVIGEMSLSEQDIRDIMAAKGAEAVKKATLPSSPDGFTLDLPQDFVMPQGQQFQWDLNNPVVGPLLQQAKQFAFEAGLSQPQFSKLLSLYAASVVSKNSKIADARNAELNRLGATGPQRITAITTWLRGLVGDKSAAAISRMMFTADYVEGLEKLAMKMINGHGSTFTQIGRDPQQYHPQDARVSEEQWATMSNAQKLDYTRGFDQRQFNNPNVRS
jgi:hypothetical protein